MAGETGELAFVATMRDEASSIAKQARKNLDSVGGDVKPIVAEIKGNADGAKRAAKEAEGALEGISDKAAAEGEEGGRKLGDGLVSGLNSAKGKILGGIAGLGIGASLIEGLGIEAANDKLAAELGAGPKEAARIAKVSADLYAGAWGDSAADVSGAVAAVKSSITTLGSGRELKNASIQALDFATIFEVDVARAAAVAGVAMKSGLAKNAEQAFDLLTAASQRVPKDLREDVLDATEEYSQFFQAVGLKGPQAFAVLVQGAKDGQYGIDKAGDAIKEFTIRATDMSTGTTGALKKIGLDARTTANDLLAGGEVAGKATQRVVEGLLKIKDPAKQANTAIALFGTPLEDIGVKDIPKFLSALDASGKGLGDWKGSIKDAGAVLNDNAATNLKSFARQAKQTFVDLVGGKVLPVVEDLALFLATEFGPAVEKAGEIIGKVAGFLREHETAAKILAGTIAALIVVTAAHSAVLAVGAAGGMKAWLTSTRLISGATKVWAAVQWAMNAALLANPIVLIVVAIVALIAAIVLLIIKSKRVREAIVAAWNAIKNGVGAAVKWIGNAVGKAWDWISSKTKAIFSGIKNGIVNTFNGIKSGISSAVDWVRDKIVDGFGKAKDGAIKVAERLVTFVTGLPGKILEGLGDLGSLLLDAGKAVVQGLIDGIKSLDDMVIDAAKALADKLPGWVKKVLGISSPSKVMAELGRHAAAGLAVGLADSTRAEREAAAMANRVARAATPTIGEISGLANASAFRSLATVRSNETITIRHEVVSPDGTVSRMTAAEIADLIARDPKAAAAVEKALRPGRRRQAGNTIESSR